MLVYTTASLRYLPAVLCVYACLFVFLYHYWNRFADYLTGKMSCSPPQASVPAKVYSLLIRKLAQEAAHSFRAKPCEWVGGPSLLACPEHNV